MSQPAKRVEAKCEDCQSVKAGVALRKDVDAKLCPECYAALGGEKPAAPAAPKAASETKEPVRTVAVVADLIVKQAYAMEERKDLSMGKLLTLVREHKRLTKEAVARAN